MRWIHRLEQVCGAEQLRDFNTSLFGRSHTIPWVEVAEERQLQELLQLAADESRRVLPAGAGEHQPDRALAQTDALVSLRPRAAIVDYEAADLTLVAQSGVALHELDRIVAAQNQSLAIDCARGTQATLGGAVAGNRSGLDRLCHGTWRDHVLGARVMHADGSITKTGSRVVKSVSGYDLAKLYVGSQGSLVFLLDINLRLLCRPQTMGTVRAMLSRHAVADALSAVHADRALQPASILVVLEPGMQRRAGDIDVVVRFEGRAPVVAEQLERCRQHTGGQILEVSDAQRLAHTLRQQCEPVTGKPWMRLLSLPVASLSHVLELSEGFDSQSGFVAQYGVGVAHLNLSPEVQRRLRHKLDVDDRLRLEWGNVATQEERDGWREKSSSGSAPLTRLQQSIRGSFDPHGVLVGGENVDSDNT